MTPESSPSASRSFLSGNEALAQGAYEAGVKVAASYPGTPASEILQYLADRCPEVDSQWSVNEKVAYEVTLGASMGGLRSLYASKHVGLNVAMDPLMTSAYTGVGAGFVVVTSDDPGVHSSQNEQDSRLVAHMSKLPILEPADPQEAYDFVKVAFELSEEFDTPVLVRLTTRISHTKADVCVGQRQESPFVRRTIDIEKYVMVPKNSYPRHRVLLARLDALQDYSEKTSLHREEYRSDALGIVTNGVSYLYAREILPEASIFKVGMSFPFPSQRVLEFCRRVKRVLVLEELEPYMEGELRKLGIACQGKHPSFRLGELRPELVPLILEGQGKPEEKRTGRPPIFCAGCPHRPVFWILNKLKVTVAGDVGCYSLGALPPLRSLHTCLCMGSGTTLIEGFRKSLGENVVGVLGDSTFVHSGITGLINLAYNGTRGVVIILDNGTTAMTGSQPHPGTGRTIRGHETKRLNLSELCKACGADRVIRLNPFDIKALEAAIVEGMRAPALTVLITEHPCRLIDRKRDPVPVLDPGRCRRCGLCLSTGCPALSQNDDRTLCLDPRVCVGCGLCGTVCPFEALKNPESTQ